MDDSYAKKLFDVVLSINYWEMEFGEELGRNERRLLTVLSNSQKQLTVGEAGAMLKTTKPLTSQTVSKLEKRGYVKRSWSKTDRRRIILNITSKGQNVLESTRSEILSYIEARLKNLTGDENKVLLELAAKAFKPEPETEKAKQDKSET